MDRSIECCVACIVCVANIRLKTLISFVFYAANVIFTQARDIYTLSKFGTVRQTLTPSPCFAYQDIIGSDQQLFLNNQKKITLI